MRRSEGAGAVSLLVSITALVAAGCGARTTLSSPEPAPRAPDCGNHIAEEGEACDDGNTSTSDACVNGCELARCGDGLLRASFEACDDGNQDNTDGCRNTCALPTCGDAILDFSEECDDGNGVDSDTCPSLCLFARCGDGFVQTGVEECDAGAANSDTPAFLLTQGEESRSVRPVENFQSVEGFYSYSSASSHTGFEQAGASRLYLYRDLSSGLLSLITHHGIDADATGQSQEDGRVLQSFQNLPSPVFVAIEDDKENELSKDSETSAVGDWKFQQNTDGGALAGLPSPGAWSIDITSDFKKGIDAWAYVDAPGELIDLTLNAEANLTSFNVPSACRLDCTRPRCGDGILDGGEVCDDANTSDGDGCAADCKSTQ